jgi:antitoxin component of MazEF toxin-antitoxin module
MAVVRKLQNIGGSRGVILPRAFLDQLALEDDAQVEISLEGNHIVIVAHRPAKAAKATTKKAKG